MSPIKGVTYGNLRSVGEGGGIEDWGVKSKNKREKIKKIEETREYCANQKVRKEERKSRIYD